MTFTPKHILVSRLSKRKVKYEINSKTKENYPTYFWLESEKFDLKLNIQKTKIMAFGPITSWQIDGERVETVKDFILGTPKSLHMVTAAIKLKEVCSLEEKLWPT